MKKQTMLLIPEKADIELEQIFATWTAQGGIIKRLGKYWVKDEEIAQSNIVIYGNQTFSLVLEQLYGVKLISPDDTLIARLDKKWTKREIKIAKLIDLQENEFPVFVKPVIPKLFIAGVFQSLSDFQSSTKGLDAKEELIISSIVENIECEARVYVKDGLIMDLASYEGFGDLETAHSFLTTFLADAKNELPKVVVIDIAYSKTLGWFILEFNACWGAGLNNCDAKKVIACIVEATENQKA